MPACCPPEAAAVDHAAHDMHAMGASVGAEASWLPPEYLMLLTMMPLMVLFHCPGMCGPLIMSFRFGLHREGRRARVLTATGQLLAYQAGRGLLYAVFGALVGGLGMLVQQQVQTVNRLMVLLIAAAFLLLGLYRLGAFAWLRRGAAADAQPSPGIAGRLVSWLRRVGPRGPYGHAACLGAALAFMPCGLTFMALGWAASRASVWEGVVIMLALVVLTTVPLLLIALLPAIWQRCRIRAGSLVEAGLYCFAGVWLGLHALAVNGLIAHAAVPLHIGDTRVMLMFW